MVHPLTTSERGLQNLLYRVWMSHGAPTDRPVGFRNPHSLVNSTNSDCPRQWCADLGQYAHYTLTAEAMAATQRKVEQHRTDPNFIQCRPASLHHGACHDYELLYDFMRAQETNPWRDISTGGVRLCPLAGRVAR